MAETVASKILGTLDNDVLLGTPGDDEIDALAGNDDIVTALGGNDTINAGSGDDNASAGDGDDRVLGGTGVDFIRGGAGNDTLDGEAETDTLIGDDGDDTISGGDGNDLIFGDRIDFGGTGNDILRGGAGDDKILGAEGDDQIFGDGGKDILNGSLGNDSVYGGAGNDQVFGFTEADQVYGENGDDLVNGGDGNDLVSGGKGNDIVFGLSAETSQSNFGKGEIDTLTGNEGNDIFALGDILPDGTLTVFYDDGDAATPGTGDYALITDFETGSANDVIQLTGSAANYSLGEVPTGLPDGAGIFYSSDYDSGTTPELISIVAGISSSDLSLSNSNQFTFSEPSSQQPQIEVLASGLDSPRKLSFGPDGALYVAEAGRGGTGASIPSPSIPGAVLSYGATGAITRIQDGKVERVVTGLPSLALPDGGDASGVSDVEFDSDGNAYAIIGFAGNPALRDSTIQVPDFSQLIAIDDFDGGSSWTRLVDFGAYEQANNPDGQDVNTNLYDLLIKDNTAYVLDAGGNDLLSQRAFGGGPTLESVFESRTITDPLTGQSTVQQPVPTAVTVGADGAFYVSELTGAPFQAGVAQIYRLTADGQPEVYADGFTNVVDLAADQSGGLYVLEYDADGIGMGSDAGALIYLSPDGKTRTTITDELVSPTGLTIGADGDLYISNKGFIAGQGEVLRLSGV